MAFAIIYRKTCPAIVSSSLSLCITGEEVERSYTPVCSLSDAGTHRHPPPASGAADSSATPTEGETIDLMIKLYQDGKMSRYLSDLKKGKSFLLS